MQTKNNNLLKYILILLFFILIFQTLYYYPKLPDTIAGNYNAHGEPSAWMPKKIFYITIISIFSFLFILLIYLPYIINKLPMKIINFPNKHLWFNKLIFDKTKARITYIFDALSIGLFIFIIFNNQLTITASLKKTNLKMNYFFLGILIFFVFLILWVIKLYFDYSKKNYLIFVRDNFFHNEKIDKDKLLILLGANIDLTPVNLKIKKKEYDFNEFEDIFMRLN